MPEALQQPPIETGNTQKINQTLDVVNSSLNINEIPLGPKARLVPNGAEGPHSSEDIKKFTPIKPLNPDQFTETSLPDFLRNHIGEIARNIMPEGQYRIFVPDSGSPNEEKKLELLKHTIELVQDPDSGLLSGLLDEALNRLGVQRLPRVLEDGTEQDTSSAVFTLASLQAALIDQAKELVSEFSKQPAKSPQLIETSTTAAPYTNRGEIYGVVRNKMSDGSVELSGKTGATIDRNISFKSGENTINIPTSHVLQILRESLDTQSPDGQTAKNYGEKLAALLHQSFGDVPQVKSFVETYKKYLDGQATEQEVSLLFEQVKPGAFREKEGNFLREAFKQHREHFDDTAKIDSAVREDLVAAQQLVNSMIPPGLQKALAILDYEIKQAQEDGDDQRRDELIRDKDKKRQTFYKAIMYAYNVHPDNKSMYDLADGAIEYTDEERNIGEMVKQRRNQVITYESFEGWGGERQTTRNSMNAIDANRLTCSELLHEFGVDLKPDWEELEALQQAVLPTAQHEFNQAMDEYNRQNTAGMEERLRPKKPHMESFIREHLQRELMNVLTINPDDPNIGIVTNILKNSLQTEARLQGMRHMVSSQETELLNKLAEPRFQKLTGNLPERLALTKFREMGLKGVEFLYRRSLTEPSKKVQTEIPPEPVVQPPEIEELNQKGIHLMEIHQDNKRADLLDQLDNSEVNLKDFVPQETPATLTNVESPVSETANNPVAEKPDEPVPFTPTVPEIDILKRLEEASGSADSEIADETHNPHPLNGASEPYAPTPIETDILTLERHNPSPTNGQETNGHETNGNGSHEPFGEAPINWTPPHNGSGHEQTEHNPTETVKQLIDNERRNGLEKQRIIRKIQPPGTQPLSLIETSDEEDNNDRNGSSEEKADTGLPVPGIESNGSGHNRKKSPAQNGNPKPTNGNAQAEEANQDIIPPPKPKRTNRRKSSKGKQEIIQTGEFSDFDDFPSAENTAHSGFIDAMDQSSAPSVESDNKSEGLPEIDQNATSAEAAVTTPDKQEHAPTYEEMLQKLAEKKAKIKASYENNNLEAARSKKTEYAREQSTAFSVWFKNNQDEINPGIDALSRFMNNYFAGKIVRGGNVADIGPLNETAEKFYEAFGVDPRTITEKELYPIFKGLFSTQYNHRGPFNQMQAVHILDLVQSCAQFISRDPVSRNDPVYPLVMYLYKDYKKVLQEVMDCRIIDFETPPDTMKNQAVTYPGIHYTGDQVEDESLVTLINYLGNPLTKEMRKKRWTPR